METKICKTCLQEKNIEDFRKSGKHIRGDCKQCENKKCKDRNLKNAEHIKEKQKEYRNNHKVEREKYRKEHYNSVKQKEYNNTYYKEHKEYYSLKHKEYVKNNKDKITKIRKKWVETNKDKIKKYQRRDADKRRSNPILKLELQLRNMLNTAFKRKNYRKNSKLESIVGLNAKEMVNYLLQTFKDNYGYEWDGIEKVHIDHIKPLKNCKTEEEVFNYCHYTNLQLLKAKDNMEKGSKDDWKLETRNCE